MRSVPFQRAIGVGIAGALASVLAGAAGGSATASSPATAAPSQARLAAAAGTGETVLVDGIPSPEGPLFVNRHLYYVSAGESRFYRLDGGHPVVLNAHRNCGHNGVAITADKKFLLACSSLDHPGIIKTTMKGKELRRWHGRIFRGGVNDIVVAKDGGIYATICGPFEKLGPVVGRVVYHAPRSRRWVTVARNLNYANGLGLSPDQRTLYVSETIGNSIKKFRVRANGHLSHRRNFALLNTLIKNKVDEWSTGPDSMKIDSAGNMYVAQWTGGRILKISPRGRLLHVFNVAAGDGTMNVAFDRGERHLFVAVAHDPNDPTYTGAIVRLDNE